MMAQGLNPHGDFSWPAPEALFPFYLLALAAICIIVVAALWRRK